MESGDVIKKLIFHFGIKNTETICCEVYAVTVIKRDSLHP